MSLSSISRRAALGFAGAFLALTAFPAIAAVGEKFEERRHGAWTSALLVHRGSDQVLARASVLSSASDDFFVIDFLSPDTYRASLILDLPPDTPRVNRGLGTFRAELRIDRGQIFRVTAEFSQDGEFAFVNFGAGLDWRFLSELRAGRTLRVHLIVGDDELYDRFPLAGATAALNHAKDLIGRYRRGGTGGDEDYFPRGRGGKPRSPSPDVEYF
ncbi:hypothetical protein [Sutterella sp.]|uniref:hypothetical protein n=1 Tax=Sutterella sp. TaxID=1981025 RepID=UPI0026DF086B|nr:hypothetical protein [Sutterella sp.]MDO5531626.1 hypothetical protein [Sutterella sp.]